MTFDEIKAQVLATLEPTSPAYLIIDSLALNRVDDGFIIEGCVYPEEFAHTMSQYRQQG